MGEHTRNLERQHESKRDSQKSNTYYQEITALVRYLTCVYQAAGPTCMTSGV